MLEARSLQKATVPANLLRHPSPASIQPTRLALRVNHEPDNSSDSSCSVYFASGSWVYTLQILMGESLTSRGKDNLMIPSHAQVTSALAIDRSPHQFEIQSIAVKQVGSTNALILGSVDSYGHLIVTELDVDGGERFTFQVSPQDIGIGEGSWAGLSFSSYQGCTVAVARSFAKCIDIYQHEIHFKTLRTLWYPSSITFVENQFYGTESSILAVTEGCQLTMWDLRMKENGGCLKRICCSPGDILYATSISSDGKIAVGGADRSVTIYDPRRWSVMSRWGHCSKYEITGLAFSSVNPDYIYIQGLENEVSCGHWSEGKKVFSFRGDSNWLGFSKCPDRDVLGGWCDSGSIFVADIITKKDHSSTSEQ